MCARSKEFRRPNCKKMVQFPQRKLDNVSVLKVEVNIKKALDLMIYSISLRRVRDLTRQYS